MIEPAKYKLTNDQNIFREEFLEFIENDEDNIYILKGYAGTGKTFMLKLITDYLDKKKSVLVKIIILQNKHIIII